jgi:hypothetical protein
MIEILLKKKYNKRLYDNWLKKSTMEKKLKEKSFSRL